MNLVSVYYKLSVQLTLQKRQGYCREYADTGLARTIINPIKDISALLADRMAVSKDVKQLITDAGHIQKISWAFTKQSI